MQAGRELDALVAEKVMGLKPQRTTLDMGVFTVRREWLDAGDYYIDSGDAVERVPDYSTDIAAAWQVVEWMIEQTRAVQDRADAEGWTRDGDMKWFLDHDDRGFWCGYKAAIDYEGDRMRICPFGATAPLAICLAALQLVMPEGE